MSAETPVQHQLEACNARDLVRFVAACSDDIRVFRLPATEPIVAGKAAFEGVVLLIVGDARAIVAYFAFVNRIADRLGVELETTGAWRSGRHVRRTKLKETHVRPQGTRR